MRNTSKPAMSPDQIAEKASRGADVSAHFTNEFKVVRPTLRVTVYLTPGMLRQLDQLALRFGIPRSEVIETLLSGALEEGRSGKPE